MAKHRNDRQKGSRRSDWDDERLGDFQEPAFFSRRGENSVPTAIDAEVLWFNAAKGFGFVQPRAGAKAFLHIRQLEAAGLREIAEGAQLRVVIEPGPKGPSVTRIAEVVSAPGRPALRKEPLSPPSERNEEFDEAAGTVKWYDPEKGFGFIARNEGGKDIFVHASAVARSGISALVEGQAVVVHYVQGKKGLEATAIRPA